VRISLCSSCSTELLKIPVCQANIRQRSGNPVEELGEGSNALKESGVQMELVTFVMIYFCAGSLLEIFSNMNSV